jgi:hypothetical protein
MIENQDESLLVVGSICDRYPIHSMFAKFWRVVRGYFSISIPICLEGKPGAVAVRMRELTRQLGRYLSQEFCHRVSAFRGSRSGWRWPDLSLIQSLSFPAMGLMWGITLG